jgi:hypothetical protein
MPLLTLLITPELVEQLTEFLIPAHFAKLKTLD